MTKRELAVLATIPEVLRVLRKLSEEAQELRQLSASLGGQPVMSVPANSIPQLPSSGFGAVTSFAQMDAIVAQRTSHLPPQPVVLRTPEREEYEAELRGETQPPPAIPVTPANAERRKQQQAFLAQMRGAKEEKLAKLRDKSQPPSEDVTQEPLNLSGGE